jgi:predicted metal-dependent phosphoesterase TrpH
LQLKIDLHVHSCYSYDSLIKPKELRFYARKSGLDGVAITDHDRLDSAMKIAREAALLVVPGMEISSSNGHILGLCVSEAIPKGLSPDETVEKIHEAGGLAVACHPVTLFKGSLGKHTSSRFDAVEVINASAFPFRFSVKRARQIAVSLHIGQVGGTDAHYGPEIGCAYTVVDSELRVDRVVEAIRKGSCYPLGKAIPWRLRLKKQFLMGIKTPIAKNEEKSS